MNRSLKFVIENIEDTEEYKIQTIHILKSIANFSFKRIRLVLKFLCDV